MPRITIKVAPGLCASQHRHITLEVDEGITVRGVMEKLSREYGLELMPKINVPGIGEVPAKIIVMQNGRSVWHVEGESARVSDGDQLLVLRLTAGG